MHRVVRCMFVRQQLLKSIDHTLYRGAKNIRHQKYMVWQIVKHICFLKKKIIINNGSLIPGIIAGILFAIEFIFLFTALDYSTVTRVS